MASMFNSVPVLTLQARIIGLYSREGYEIGEDVSSIDASNSIIITDRNRNLFMLIFFWSKDGAFGLQEINGLRNNMDLLKMKNSYLYTDYVIDEQLKSSAEEMGISIVDYPDMEARGITRVQQMYAPPVNDDKPLPFERYIPWFVGISLFIIIFAVVVLVSVGISFVPVTN